MSQTIISIGDWVNSYSKGIYRVERIIVKNYEAHDPLPPGKAVGDEFYSVVTKRLLNSKFKKSLSYETCSDYFIFHLDAAQTAELEKVLAEHPEYLKELDEYQIPVIESLYNRELQIDDEKDLAAMEELIGYIKYGRTFMEIENEMARLDLARLEPKKPWGNYLFQLINFDEEYQDKQQIWRDARLKKK